MSVRLVIRDIYKSESDSISDAISLFAAHILNEPVYHNENQDRAQRMRAGNSGVVNEAPMWWMAKMVNVIADPGAKTNQGA